jgi:nicotinate-nucleotide adenylyltransferase
MEMAKSAPEGKIGIFGGTFDPIHYGHLRSAEEVRGLFELQKVIFIPAAYPPHKDEKKVTEPIHRLEMVRIAISDNPFFDLSDIEFRRDGKSYSIETIKLLINKYGEGVPLFFILGSDAFAEIDTWKSFEEVLSITNFIVIERPGIKEFNLEGLLPEHVYRKFRWDKNREAFIHESGCGVYFRRCTQMDISSTKIREIVRRKGSIKYLLPKSVEEYIYREDLYS